MNGRTGFERLRPAVPILLRMGRPALFALPYAVLLSLALAASVIVGANVANATPSESHPFGWPGPASFDAGVATQRTSLVIAATISGLVLGLMAFRGPRSPTHPY